jgi:UDP-glucose:(heptosyl)LPS alpha-1,3-glucosyltransferase
MKIPSEITLIKSQLHKKGGLEKYTWQIARDFCLLGIPVTVLTSGVVQPPFDDPHLKIASLPIGHCLSFLNIMHFDKVCHEYLREHPTPIVFSLDRNRFQTHIRAGNGVHAAYLQHRSEAEGRIKKLSFALNPLHQAILSLEKKAFEHPELKLLFTNSEMVKQELLRFYRTDPEKIRVVHNGVEWHAMQSSFESWDSQKEINIRKLGLDPAAFQLLFVGHNFYRKGLEKLLKALTRLKQDNFQLSIVGKEKKISYFHLLVEQLGLQGKVFFFGPQQETIPFYQIADCAIIPSVYDPFANVTVEALAMGVFVISSKHNGGHEILTPSNGAVIKSLDDLDSFSHVLKTSLTRSKSIQSANAIRESVKHLDFSNQLKIITQTTLNSSHTP